MYTDQPETITTNTTITINNKHEIIKIHDMEERQQRFTIYKLMSFKFQKEL